ncbi:unnamed protein product [Adineta steineri]|uniref:Uncharacterized protein n=1 Tax=Adineta steineri TaxID=433720 RepID=A0A813YD48_9BILA|nr:unnamed protein product [Adineta steineri]CAF0888192.1 unnamed protein product [Adineta steineri]
MKPRYNLRIQPTSKISLSTTNKKTTRTSSSRVTKKSQSRRSNPIINQQNRRHSLRLTPTVKQTKSRTTIHETLPKWRNVENENEDDNSSINHNDGDDDYDDLLARHQRLMLEEQKDRKLYERYIRDQRTLRRLQCRRSHTAHLNERTRNRLLRELERERRYTIHDKICTYLSDHRIIYRHGCNIRSNQSITWSTLENEIPYNKNIGTIHELDVMINNLKKVIRNSKSMSKTRLSVRERQNQRLKTVNPSKTKSTEINTSSMVSNPTLHIPSQLEIISHLPRIPVVRFIDDQNNKLRISNSQRLTCIQNVLGHQSNNNNNHNKIVTNEISSPMSIRKSPLRSKTAYVNASDITPTKKRPLEKENFNNLSTSTNSNAHSNIALRASSPYVAANDHTPYRSSLFSIEWYRSNIPRLLRRLVPTQIRENIH